MKKTFYAFIPMLLGCALLAGCGKGGDSDEAAAEELIEKSISANGDEADVDLDSGKMRFTSTDAEGRKSDITVENDTVKIVGEEGTAEFMSGEATKIPDNFPKDVFIYPGAKPDTAMTFGESVILSLKTPDAVAKVGERYKSEFAAAGWKESATSTSDDSWMVSSTKDNRTATVVASRDGDVTGIMLTVESKPAE